MIAMYKILHGMVRIDTSKLFTMADTARTCEHDLKVFKKHTMRLVRRKVFSQRTVNDWNSLPQHVVHALSINNFKEQLDKFW